MSSVRQLRKDMGVNLRQLFHRVVTIVKNNYDGLTIVKNNYDGLTIVKNNYDGFTMVKFNLKFHTVYIQHSYAYKTFIYTYKYI